MPKRSLIYLTSVQVKSHRLIAYTIKTKEPPANQALLLTLATLGSLEVFSRNRLLAATIRCDTCHHKGDNLYS